MSKPINEKPDASEYGQMRSFYAQLKNADGSPALSNEEIQEILGAPNEYARGQILKRDEGGVEKGVIPWCASLKKVQP